MRIKNSTTGEPYEASPEQVAALKEAIGHRVCGDCSMCCKLLEIHEFEKPAGKWCSHCSPGSKHPCKIYSNRPDFCESYQCFWKLTGKSNLLPEHWKPSLSGILIYLDVDPNLGPIAWVALDHSMRDGWKKEPWFSHLFLLADHFRGSGINTVIKGKDFNWWFSSVNVVQCPKNSYLAILDKGGLRLMVVLPPEHSDYTQLSPKEQQRLWYEHASKTDGLARPKESLRKYLESQIEKFQI